MHRSSADRKGTAQSKRTPPPNSRSKRRFLFADSESDDDIVPQKVAAQPARGGALSPSDKWQRKLDHVQSKRTDISPTNRVQSRRAYMSPTNRSLTPPPRPPRKTTPRADSDSTPRVPHTPPSTSVYSASPHTLRVRSELDAKAAASSQTRARASTSPPDHASSAGREKSVYATSSPARKDNSSPVSCGNCFRLEKEVEILRRTLAVERTAHDQELRDVTGELQEALDAERRTKAEVVSSHIQWEQLRTQWEEEKMALMSKINECSAALIEKELEDQERRNFANVRRSFPSAATQTTRGHLDNFSTSTQTARDHLDSFSTSTQTPPNSRPYVPTASTQTATDVQNQAVSTQTEKEFLELEDFARAVEQKEEEASRLTEEVKAQLEALQAEMAATVQELQDQKQQAQKEFEKLTGDLQHVRGEAQELKAEAESKQREIDAMSKQLEDLKTETSQKEEKEKALMDALETSKQIEAEGAALKTVLAEREVEMGGLQARIAELSEQQKKAEEQAAEQAAELQAAKETSADTSTQTSTQTVQEVQHTPSAHTQTTVGDQNSPSASMQTAHDVRRDQVSFTQQTDEPIKLAATTQSQPMDYQVAVPHAVALTRSASPPRAEQEDLYVTEQLHRAVSTPPRAQQEDPHVAGQPRRAVSTQSYPETSEKTFWPQPERHTTATQIPPPATQNPPPQTKHDSDKTFWPVQGRPTSASPRTASPPPRERDPFIEGLLCSFRVSPRS